MKGIPLLTSLNLSEPSLETEKRIGDFLGGRRLDKLGNRLSKGTLLCEGCAFSDSRPTSLDKYNQEDSWSLACPSTGSEFASDVAF